VQTYSLQVKSGESGASWEYVRDKQGKPQIFNGNEDGSTLHIEDINQPITAQFVRIYPKTYYLSSVLSWELYVC